MARDPNESNCIDKMILKCQWRHWPILLVGKNVVTLTLGLWPRQRLMKVRAKSEARESHFMLLRVWKVGENELHTPKWTPTLGIGILMILEFSKSIYRGQNPLDWKVFYIIGKLLELLKMGLHDPFGYLKHKLWPKETMKVKWTDWLSTIKSQESPQFPYV
jgi:hypothetical protein